MKIREAVQVMYPQCRVCHKNIGKKPCMIGYKDDEGNVKDLVVCGACYTLWYRLHQMERFGLVEWEEHE